jgi:hypothetical protein
MSDTKLGQGPDSSWSNKGVACFAIFIPPVKKLINYPDFIEIDFLSSKSLFPSPPLNRDLSYIDMVLIEFVWADHQVV